MIDLKLSLSNLAEGDIFHGECPNGASLICLVTSVSETVIEARTVTTQLHFQFDRQTGIAEWGDEPVICTIDSVAPLPMEIHKVMLGIDRKFRQEHDPDDPDRFKLSDAEKRALIFVASHYPSNPL
ncbi:MAG: hypothetical protein P4L55_21495 [Syntrophobacteraceae bacterium]|nr:hypothetical protein [Syntrophobacteraceae bacterium]